MSTDHQNDTEFDYITDLRGKALGQVAAATRSIKEAAGHIAELASPGVFDIEIAEGVHGIDLKAELETAARALRNTERIMRHVIAQA